MRTCLLWCTSLLVVAAGCGTTQSPKPSTPVGTSACTGGSATGEWSGTGAGPAGHVTGTGTLWQDGTKLSGTFRWNNTDQNSAWDHTVEGSVQCDSRVFTLHTVNIGNQGLSTWSISGGFSPDFASMTGTWNVDGGGKFTANKR